MNASVYKVIAKDHLSYFVKQKRDTYNDIHLTVLGLLHDAKIQEVIYPIKTINDQLALHTEDFSLIVYPFIDGQNGFSCALTDEQWLILGKVLRQVHEINVPSSLQQKLRKESYSPKWREQVRQLYRQVNIQQSNDGIAIKLLAFLKEHILAIHRLVDRAEQLAQKLQNEALPFVLCHSDIHAGNVIISEDNAIYIVDWDEPILAPKERDLMFIGGGVGNVWNKPQEVEVFYRGYGKATMNMEAVAYYRCERIVEDIAIYTQELFSSIVSSADRSEMYKQFLDMFEPNGVVDIAFKTVEQL